MTTNKAILFSNTAIPDLTGYKALSKTGIYYDDSNDFSMLPDDYAFFVDENGERHYSFTTTKESMLCFKMADTYKYATVVEPQETYSIVFLKDRFDKLPDCKRVVMWPYGMDWNYDYALYDCKISHYASFFWNGERHASDGSDDAWKDAIAEGNFVAIIAE